ncbi:unnamed protein product [Jaminaea pallidilutea]
MAQQKAYPHRTFETQLLPTDATPLDFAETSPQASAESSQPASPSRQPHLEPLRRVQISSCGQTTRSSLQRASEALHSQLPVAFPTETVYGLSANALSAASCKAIFDAKGRPQDNPLIVHVCDLDMAEEITMQGWEAPRSYEAIMKRFWPGGVTLLMPAARKAGTTTSSAHATNGIGDRNSSFFKGKGKADIPLMVTAQHPLVGIRMPSHPLARALIAHARLPLAAPSANASGRPSPTTAHHVMYDLGGGLEAHSEATQTDGRGRIPYVLDGGSCSEGVESTVIDGITDPTELRILRPGAVGPEEIEQCLVDAGLSVPGATKAEATANHHVKLRVYGRDTVREVGFEANPTTPGMKYRHYSPTAPVVLFVPSSQGTQGLAKWDAVLQQELKELSAAKETPAGSSTGPLRVGIMLLADSALANALSSRATQPVKDWLEAQRQPPRTPSTTAANGDERKLEEEEMLGALSRSFPLQLESEIPGQLTEIDVVLFSLGNLSAPHLPARRLFAGLRRLDAEVQVQVDQSSQSGRGDVKNEATEFKGVDLIVVEAVDDKGIGLAVMNRIGKAAGGTVQVAV